MKQRAIYMMTVALAAVSMACGGGSGEDPTAAAGAPETAAAEAPAAPGGFTRASFVLCDALEPHRAELASIIGFEQDTERAVAVSSSQCVVRGFGGNFARVQLLPALVPSVAAHADAFDGEASAATEVGDDAMFVADGMQPHVVFSMGSLFIDVNAENTETPSRETMIALARRVREILTDANS